MVKTCAHRWNESAGNWSLLWVPCFLGKKPSCLKVGDRKRFLFMLKLLINTWQSKITYFLIGWEILKWFIQRKCYQLFLSPYLFDCQVSVKICSSRQNRTKMLRWLKMAGHPALNKIWKQRNCVKKLLRKLLSQENDVDCVVSSSALSTRWV